MTPATLQALRRLLFFSAPEAAALIGNVTERSWQFWESGKRPIPLDVMVRMQELVQWRKESIEHFRQKGNDLVLLWFASLEAWTEFTGEDPVLWRLECSVVAELCANHGATAIEFDPEKYAAWLGKKKDSQKFRHQWACVQALVEKRGLDNSQNSA
jgi:hypothetical protein